MQPTTQSTSATAATTTTTTTAAGSSGNGAGSSQQQQSTAADNNNKKAASPSEIEGVHYGKCKWFNVAKGWGFITPNDGGQEVFVHQSVIQMSGFRSLGEQEEVEYECKLTARGLEATRVSGSQGLDCHGSTYRPRTKKRYRRMRCYNCGEFANHIAAKCQLGPQPKRCHLCKQETHLFVDCPMRKTQTGDEAAAAAGEASGSTDESEGNASAT